MNRLAQLVRERLREPSVYSLARVEEAASQGRPSSTRPHVASAVTVALTARARNGWGIKTGVQTIERTQTALRGAIATSRLSERVGGRVLVGTACLEHSPLALREQICEFGRRARAAGIKKLQLVPLFLMRGVHVMEDIPAEVSAARQLLGNELEIGLCPHLGSHADMANLLSQKLSALSADGHLLVAHGSRRPKGNYKIELLAQSLGAAVAYWATPPDLETQVINLMQQGHQKLTILPYFLFAGGITDAIIHLTEELAERFPRVCFRLMPPIGATPEVADLVVDLVRQPSIDG